MNKSFDLTRETCRMNSRLQRIVVRALKQSRERANDMQILSTLVATILRPESEADRETLLEALGHLVDTTLMNATIAKEGIEIACKSAIQFGGDVDAFLSAVERDGSAMLH